MKNLYKYLVFSLVFFLNANAVFAHAVVKPASVGVGSFNDFTLGVPSEKDASTTAIKLFVPEGINSVTPIVKPGWNVQIINSDKQGEPDDDGNTNPIPEAIVWTGGSVPAHQKDFFMFSTQVPAKETELDWKIEQTYSDGSVVSWNLAADAQPKDENGNPDFSKSGPYSKTMVVNDLKSGTPGNDHGMSQTEGQSNQQSTWPLILSGLALAISAFSIVLQYKKK